MILTDEQLISTKESLAELKKAYEAVSTPTNTLEVIEKSSLESLVEQLNNEIKVYIEAKEQRIELKDFLDVNELKEQLILNRLYMGVSQDELAEALTISKSSLLRLESTRYENASLSLLIKASELLGHPVKVVTDVIDGTVSEIYNIETSQEIPLLELIPIKELIRKKWVSTQNSIEELKQLIFNSGSLNNFAYHKKSTFSERSAKCAALFAWETKILFEAKKIISQNQLEFIEYNPMWISELVELTTRPNGPYEAKQLLLNKGIVLVVERHLDQTYLDGAALLSDEGFPVIGMTLRHDRIDNFWFVLFHELAHVYLHLLTNKFPTFLDEKVGEDRNDPIEQEANEFARNRLIPPEKWAKCVSQVMTTKKAVLIDAKNLGVHPAIVAGRLQFDKGDYTIFHELLGRGEVRKVFGVK